MRPAAAAIPAAILAAAVAFIVPWEGIRTKVYFDIVGVPTICVGQTKADGIDLSLTYTIAECKAMFERTLATKYYAGMRACLTHELPDAMQVAFLSAAYNIGIAAFCGSSMARRANAGDYRGACEALLMWNKARTGPGGTLQMVKGLDRRRRAERELCLQGLS
jgi:lysozyme